MRRWLKEPLLHFLVAGGLLFAAYGWLNRESVSTPNTVHITMAEVNWLRETWARQWQRPPSEQELRGLVTDYLKESLLAREVHSAAARAQEDAPASPAGRPPRCRCSSP
jgi:hypothetical protein